MFLSWSHGLSSCFSSFVRCFDERDEEAGNVKRFGAQIVSMIRLVLRFSENINGGHILQYQPIKILLWNMFRMKTRTSMCPTTFATPPGRFFQRQNRITMRHKAVEWGSYRYGRAEVSGRSTSFRRRTQSELETSFRLWHITYTRTAALPFCSKKILILYCMGGHNRWQRKHMWITVQYPQTRFTSCIIRIAKEAHILCHFAMQNRTKVTYCISEDGSGDLFHVLDVGEASALEHIGLIQFWSNISGIEFKNKYGHCKMRGTEM